jgi:hypothetical protein
MKPLSAERLREVVDYCPETGKFIRRKTGKITGCLYRPKETSLYVKVSIDGCQYIAHRLVWLYVHGRWPSPAVDHINGDGTDNRLANLREATFAQNITNVGVLKNNKIGLRGVHFHPGAKRYRAMISKNNKSFHIGYFDTPEKAHQAYMAAARTLHGEFVREDQ